MIKNVKLYIIVVRVCSLFLQTSDKAVSHDVLTDELHHFDSFVSPVLGVHSYVSVCSCCRQSLFN